MLNTDPTSSVTVGLIGCAGEGGSWATCLRADDVDLVLFDERPARARRTAIATGGESVYTLAELLARRLDGVVIATPGPIALAHDALDGASVLFATPAATDFEQLRGLVAGRERPDRTVTLASPQLAMARDVIAAVHGDGLGQLETVSLSWRLRGERSADVLGELGPHLLALVRALRGGARIDRVQVRASGDHHLLLLDGVGCLCDQLVLEQNAGMMPDEQVGIVVRGALWSIAASLRGRQTASDARAAYRPRLVRVEQGRPTSVRLPTIESLADTRRSEAGRWLDSLRGVPDRLPLSPAGAEAVHVLALLDAARRSVADGGRPAEVEAVA